LLKLNRPSDCNFIIPAVDPAILETDAFLRPVGTSPTNSVTAIPSPVDKNGGSLNNSPGGHTHYKNNSVLVLS
jgi:hypothetical protein